MAARSFMLEGRGMFSIKSSLGRRCSSSHAHRVVHLPERSVLRTRGADSFKLLQNIVSNDMLQLKPERALYAMILNAKGRTVYDVIMYVRNQNATDTFIPEYLIESDAKAAEALCSLLKRYRMRSQVELEIASEYSVWSVLPGQQEKSVTINNSSVICYSADPRLEALGHRLLLPKTVELATAVANSTTEDQSVYRRLRYELGVCEGMDELPPGDSLPLENNAVWLKIAP